MPQPPRYRSPLSITVAAGLLIVGAGAVLATVAGFFGSWWWRLDLIANFRPQLLVLLLAVGIAYAMAYRRSVGAVMVAAAAVNAVVIAPLLLGSAGEAEAGAPQISVVTFNVTPSNPSRAVIVEYLRSSGADVVLLMESSFEWEAAVSKAELPYEIVAEVPDDRRFGITALARPGASAQVIRLGPDQTPAALVRVPLGTEIISVLGVHPPSPTSADRAKQRDTLLAAAGDWAANADGPVIVAGDLNASPWSHAFRSLARRGGLTNSQRGFGLQPTWPDGWGPFMIAIDHALHTRDLAAINRETGPAFGSDHRPLLVTFAASVDR